jgi:hypothetical protein
METSPKRPSTVERKIVEMIILRMTTFEGFRNEILNMCVIRFLFKRGFMVGLND